MCIINKALLQTQTHGVAWSDKQMTKSKTGSHFIIRGTGTWALGTLSLSVF